MSPCARAQVLCAGLQRLVERAVVLGLGARQAQAAPALADLVAQYAGLLASQARAPAARPHVGLRRGALSMFSFWHAAFSACTNPMHLARMLHPVSDWPCGDSLSKHAL